MTEKKQPTGAFPYPRGTGALGRHEVQAQAMTDRIANIEREYLYISELHVEPDRVRDGMIVYADGTDWDPGGGEGFYHRINGAWVYGSLSGDHGGLTGLGDDDHTIYAEIANTETISAAWTFSTHPLGLDHTSIGSIGTNTHAQIDTHIALTNEHIDWTAGSAGTIDGSNIPDGADGSAIHDNTASEISAVTEKTTPVSADLLLIEDSAAANAKKKVQIGNLPVPASSYSFNRIYGSSTQAATSTASAITWSTSADSAGSEVTFDGLNPTRLTVASAGVYRIGGYFVFGSTAQRAQATVEIYKNGSALIGGGGQRGNVYIRNSGISYDFWPLEMAPMPVTLAANDYIEIYVGQTSGASYGYAGTATILLYRASSFFWIENAP